MLTEEQPAGDLVGRVLQEAGIEYVFCISGGHTGRIGQGSWVLGNGLIGTMEAFLSSSPMLLLTDFSDSTPFHLHAPYQQATGDYGSWDARRAFSGVTKHVVQALTPVAEVQGTKLAIKR